MADHSKTPLLSALATVAQRRHTAFYAPGHKGGQGISVLLEAVLGAQAFRADRPELPELDNLFLPEGPIQQSQGLAAEAFGAEETFFLVNGSTCGIEASVLAVCGPGDKILVPRNVHRSVLAALTLSGASPIYVSPISTRQWDLAWGITAGQIEQAFVRFPDIRAVVVVSPNYHGVCSNIADMSAVVHRHGGVLIVDEAHGPHLSFHHRLPAGAISGGADLVIQSTHKVLTAMTQASMLHVQGTRVARDRLRQALQLTQSTSPNYLLLASLDAARHQMATAGSQLLEKTLAQVDQVRSQITALSPLHCLTAAQVAAVSSQFQLDPTRLTVDVSALGLSGFTADEHLHQSLRVTAELPTLRQLAFIFSVANTPADSDSLVAALKDLIHWAAAREFAPMPVQNEPLPYWSQGAELSVPPVSPRGAFFSNSQVVGLSEAVGQISADTLCPYPPGIPVVLPGETITAAALDSLQRIRAAGGLITGGLDSTLAKVRVLQP